MVRSIEIIRYSLENVIEVKCYICKDDDPVLDDGGQFSNHAAGVHSSNGLSIQPFCVECQMIIESAPKFTQHMKNKHKIKKVNEEMKRSALMQGKISVWVSNTFKTENEAEGKIVQDISRVIEIQKNYCRVYLRIL